MTENNKLFNALDQLQFTGKVNDDELKALEKAIFTEDNLKNIKADKGSDLYDFLNNDKCTIDSIINNAHDLSEGEITNFLINNKIYEDKQFCSKHEFTAGLSIIKSPNGEEKRHFCTYNKDGKIIFNSIEDGRQPIINATIGEVKEQGCGIHAIEGVLIAEELTEKGKNIEEFKQEHKKLTETSLDDLIKQRKILFKMEILDALNNLPETVLGTVYSEKEDGTYEIDGLSKLYKLYFEEFQARCAALQAVKKELGLKPDKVKLDKVPEAPKVETQKQSDPAVIQQIKQEKEIKTEAPKVEREVQKPATRIVVENPEEKIEQQKEEDEQQDKTVVKNKENAKKLDLTEPKQENEIVNTQEVIEGRQECDTQSEEPNVSTATQTSAVSSTSTNKTPRYKVLERINDTEEKDAGFETYDVNNQPIDIDDESVKLYNKFLDQVLEEFKKEGKIVNIDLIKKKVEKKLFACFSIRNEKGETINEDDYSDKDKKDIALAKEDYKYTAEHSELIRNRFNAIEKALKEYNERLAGANKEMREKFPQQEAITAKQ